MVSRTHSEELERRRRPPENHRIKESRRRRGRRREREEEADADRSSRSPVARRSYRNHPTRRRRASRSMSEDSKGRHDNRSRKRRRKGSQEVDHAERRRDIRRIHRRRRSSRSGRRSARLPLPHGPPVDSSASPSRDRPMRAGIVSDDDSDPRHGLPRPRSASTHDDTAGHFGGGPGTVLAGRYRILQEVGRGTFGRVVESVDLKRPRRAPSHVAIKIVRAVPRYRESAMVEAAVVDAANRRGGRGLTHCVVMHDAFTFEGHYCMVFESLGPSLYDFLKAHDYRPFPMVCVQDFAVQLLETMEFLHSFRLIHTDLKIENILLMNGREVNYRNQRVPESNRIKVIDFGGATYDHDRKSTVINTRQYRAPEVILGIGWSMPSDMWSIGCILAELYQGELLFATHDSIEHLALMEHVIGCFPRRLLKAARKSMSDVFDSTGRHRLDRLSAEDARFVRKSSRLESIVRDPDDDWFLGLLRRLLHLDPQERSTAHECLQYLSHYRRDVVRYC